VALELRRAGWPRAVALVGGFDAWRTAGRPVHAIGEGEPPRAVAVEKT